MLKKDISVDQVFRNVRSDVLSKTNGQQRPVEATQLTGQAFYLNPGNFEKEFKQVEKSLINKIDLKESLDILKIIIKKDSLNSKAFSYKGHVNKLLNDVESCIKDYRRSIELDSLNLQGYYSLIYHSNGEFSYAGLINTFAYLRDKEKTNLFNEELYKINNNNPFYYRMWAYQNRNSLFSNKDNWELLNYNLNEISNEASYIFIMNIFYRLTIHLTHNQF